MSPRSEEFLDGAKRRLEAARRALAADPATALSAAYYSALYAARAALSERDKYAKSHTGTWHLFREEFVDNGGFDPKLASAAQSLQPKRERADYQAWAAPEKEAVSAIDLAAAFLGAIEELIAQLGEH